MKKTIIILIAMTLMLTLFSSLTVLAESDTVVVDGVTFSSDMRVLIKYPQDKVGQQYTVPDGVTSIGDSAFACCRQLTNVVIPEGVTSIGELAFYDCKGLSTITFPSSLISIGEYVFDSCLFLTDIYYGGTEQEWNNKFGKNKDFGVIMHFADSETREIKVVVNDKIINFGHPVFVSNGRTMVPYDAFFEAIDAVYVVEKIQWIYAARKGIYITLQLDSDKIWVNGETVHLDVPVKYTNYITYVPLRAVAESFGYTVNWDAENATILLTDATREE